MENPVRRGYIDQDPNRLTFGSSSDRLSDQAIKERFTVIRNLRSTPGDRAQALNEIYLSVIGVIPYAIKKWAPSGIPAEELFGEGFEVIAGCVDKYDPDFISPKTGKKASFISYVTASLAKRYKSPDHESTKFPFPVTHTIRQNISAMVKAYNELCQELGRYPPIDEWYQRTIDKYHVSLGKENFVDIYSYFLEKHFRSLDKERRVGAGLSDDLTDFDITLREQIPAPAGQTEPFELVNRKFLHDALKKGLARLPSRLRMIIILRFGLNGSEPKTQEEVAKTLGLTKQRISVLEQQALKKMRSPNLEDYLNR